jgi:hypothetical protein
MACNHVSHLFHVLLHYLPNSHPPQEVAEKQKDYQQQAVEQPTCSLENHKEGYQTETNN